MARGASTSNDQGDWFKAVTEHSDDGLREEAPWPWNCSARRVDDRLRAGGPSLLRGPGAAAEELLQPAAARAPIATREARLTERQLWIYPGSRHRGQLPSAPLQRVLAASMATDDPERTVPTSLSAILPEGGLHAEASNHRSGQRRCDSRLVHHQDRCQPDIDANAACRAVESRRRRRLHRTSQRPSGLRRLPTPLRGGDREGNRPLGASRQPRRSSERDTARRVCDPYARERVHRPVAPPCSCEWGHRADRRRLQRHAISEAR
jgi:hypothetical protein